MTGKFDTLAEEFVARVQAANIGPRTHVTLLARFVDENGADSGSLRIPLAPRSGAAGSKDAIIFNITEALRGTAVVPAEESAFLHLGDTLPSQRFIKTFTLEITSETD
jgi:hypothetical protein